MKLTLRDIAKRANVSPATVSNALNGRAGVSKAVQQQIWTIANEMGYQFGRENRKASRHVRLIIYKSHGLVVMDTPFFAELTESIQTECHQEGLELLISHVNPREDKDYMAQIRNFCAEECAGIILLGTEMSTEELMLFHDLRSPMVVLDNICRYQKVHAVVMNNVEAGCLAARTLCDAGHRDIGHITSSTAFSNMTDRTRGFCEGLAAYGLSLPQEQIWAVRPTISGAYEDMKALLAQGRRLPTAFFAGNDIMAVGCMRALAEAGCRIPEDVSVIGMDDTSICEACTPPLSTVHVYKRDLGVMAIRTLLSLTDESIRSTVKVEVGVSVHLRDSIRDIRGHGTPESMG